MSREFMVNHLAKTITCSKSFLKEANNPTSPKCAELMGLMRTYSDYKFVEKQIKKNFNKKTYKGLTAKAMEDFIINNHPEKLAEFKDAISTEGYPTTKKWFLNSFKGFKMAEVREATPIRKVNAIKARHAVPATAQNEKVVSISTAKSNNKEMEA